MKKIFIALCVLCVAMCLPPLPAFAAPYNFNAPLGMKEGAAPSTKSGYGYIYVGTDKKLYFKNSDGTATEIGLSGGTGDMSESEYVSGGAIIPAKGGTGVVNGANNTITFTGNYTFGVTLTNNTAVTFPTSGTLATVGGALGTPSFTALNLPSSNADPGTTAGQLRHDSTVTNFTRGALRWWDGTGIRQLVDMDATTAEGCGSGYTITYNATNDNFECTALGTSSVTAGYPACGSSTAGSLANCTLVPVIGDADTFASGFTGENLYGGTFIVTVTGTIVLPEPAAGMIFTIVLEAAVSVTIDPLGTGTADTIYMNGLAAAADENITSSTLGAMCVFQYRSANAWMATCNGFVEASPP